MKRFRDLLMSSEVKDRGVHLLDETQTPTSYPVF